MSDKNQKQQMVSLSGAAGTRPSKKNSEKKRWIILLSALAVVVILVVVYLLSQSRPAGPSLGSREFVEYTYTADDLCDDVSYYALGLTGEDEGSSMQSVSMLCFDRRAGSLSLMQVPTSMYIENFGATTVKDVWNNPVAETWCTTCRGRVNTEEQEGGKHTVCGTKLQTRGGSSSADFARVFNTQFGLPVDNYLVVSPTGLATLIDQLGGITLTLEKDIAYDDKDYKAGTAVLPGNAAVYYVTEWNYDGSLKADFARMLRQRQLWAALITRLSGYSVDQLHNTDPRRADVLTAVMNGTDPIRFDSTSFGKARLLGKANDSSTDNLRYTMAMAQFLHSIGKIPLDKVTCSIVPGESIKKGSTTVFTAYKNETIDLLNTQMNPQKLTLDDTAVGLTELAHKQKADTYTTTLETLYLEQTAKVQTEE